MQEQIKKIHIYYLFRKNQNPKQNIVSGLFAYIISWGNKF